MLSLSENLEKAEEYLNTAKSLSAIDEIIIAGAFITSKKGNKSAALQALASIDSPSSRSAALMIVAHHEGAEGALDWLEKAEIEAASLDPDGKYFLLAQLLEVGSWEIAQKTLEALNSQDFDIAPVLHRVTAITHLIGTVPTEFRDVVLKQLPFEAAGFPLASNAASMDARRTARRHFSDAVEVEEQLNCPDAATVDGEYELWLELRDPETFENGRCVFHAKPATDSRASLPPIPDESCH